MISLIAAIAEKNVIGSKNTLPWYLPRDLKHFSTTTKGHTVIMGRNTYDSIIARIGKPLPERNNIVVTKQTDFSAPGCTVVHSVEEALQKVSPLEEAFVIGGSQIYDQALSYADRLYITHVKARIEGDSFFPVFDPKDWGVLSEEHHEKDDKNPYALTFTVYERKK